jgi:hydrogenase maturation protease
MSGGGTETPALVLVIGYGNELRGDDGVGPRVARAVAGWHLPHVRALAMHQLTPELAEGVARAAAVVFVDACPGSDRGALRTETLQPEPGASPMGHVSDPRWLLALARDLYGRVPEALLVTVRADNLDYSLGLSPRAERGLVKALRYLACLLNPGSGGEGPDKAGHVSGRL